MVALTANASDGDRQRCLVSGMDDYLAKPYTKAELEQVISRWPVPQEEAAADAPAADGRTTVLETPDAPSDST